MRNARTLEAKPSSVNSECPEQKAWKDSPPTIRSLRILIGEHVEDALLLVQGRRAHESFDEVEKEIHSRLFVIARLLLVYYLTRRHERSRKLLRKFRRKGFSEGRSQSRLLGTVFGKIRYWRTYMRTPGGGGVYPLDLALGLTRDGFSMFVMSLAARLATYLTFDQVTGFLFAFLSWSPSKMTVEKATTPIYI